MIKRTLTLVGAYLLCMLPLQVISDNHAQTHFLETIPMKMHEGRDYTDMMATKGALAEFLEAGNAKYSVYILVPWAVNKGALPIGQDWDVIWLGISPSIKDYSNTVDYYLENGASIDAVYAGMRSFDTRSTSMGKTIFQGPQAEPQPNRVVLLRTCQLNKNKNMGSVESALNNMASSLNNAGSKGTSHIWMPGAGSATGFENSFFTVRTFPSVSDWGDSFTAYTEGDFSKEQKAVENAATCGAPRMYLSNPLYVADID